MLLRQFLIIAISLTFTLPVNAEIKEYIREYSYNVGDADSKVSSRQISMEEIKVELLSELGTYIDSRIEMNQSSVADDSFNHEITALTAGFVRAELLEEKFDGVTYYLKAKLYADPDEIVKKINELGKADKKAKEDKERLIAAYKESKNLRKELATLRSELKKVKSDNQKTSNLTKVYQEKTKKLSAIEMLNKSEEFYWGLGTTKADLNKAAYWAKKAAEQGSAVAQYRIGAMYEHGDGINQDISQALMWFKKSSDKEYAPAKNALAFLYIKGKGVKQDLKRGRDLYLSSAKQGYLPALFSLGQIYYQGIGVQQDIEIAREWYEKAAKEGYLKAQTNLGSLYRDKKEYHSALKWYRIAAYKGHPLAMSNLAYMHEMGLGVDKDTNEAIKLYSKAEKLGDSYAKQALIRLTK